MSFSVSYSYKIIDKYSPKLREIAKATRRFNQEINGVQENISKANGHLRLLTNETSKAARGFNKVNRASGRLRGTQKRLKKFGVTADGVKRAVGGLAVAASTGAVLGLRQMKDKSIELEQSFTNLRKQFDFASKQDFDNFQTKMGEVGGVIGQSRIEMNKLAFEAGKLGIPLEEVDQFAKLAGQVSVAFETDLGAATGVLADMRTKLGLNNSELQSTLDIVNTLADNTSANGRDILQVTQRLSGSFKSLAVPPDVAVGFATIARQLAVSPQLAASGMKIFIQRLQDTKKFDPKIGAALTKDFKGTILKVLERIKALPQETRGGIVNELFGQEAAPFILNLASSTELLNRTLGLTTDKTKILNSMQKEFARQTETGAFAQQQMGAAITDAWSEIGMIILPWIKKGTILITEWARKIADFATAHPVLTKVGVALSAVLAVVTAISAVIGGLSLTFFLTSLANLGPLFAAVFSPIGLMIAGTVAVAAGLTGIIMDWWGVLSQSTWRENLTALIDTAKYFGGILLDGVLNPIKNAWGFIDRIMQKITGFSVSQSILDLASSASNFLFGGDENLSVKKNSSVNANLSGNITVQGTGGAKVKGAEFNSNLPGNLGTNIAGR